MGCSTHGRSGVDRERVAALSSQAAMEYNSSRGMVEAFFVDAAPPTARAQATRDRVAPR